MIVGHEIINWGIDYTDADTRNDYAETNNLHPGKFKQFLYGTPEERRDVIRETNARLQPWNPKWHVPAVSRTLKLCVRRGRAP